MKSTEARLNAVERSVGPPPQQFTVLLPGDDTPPGFVADYSIPFECSREYAEGMRRANLIPPGRAPLVTA